MEFSFHPLTTERWSDFEQLFGPRGACGGCWCMSWRLSRTDFDRRKGEGNRRAMRSIVLADRPTGILAYDGTKPVGWCAVAPRTEFARLEAHRTLKRLDTAPVWSIVCLFISRAYRRQRLSTKLIEAACDYAAQHGATVIEAYPTEPGKILPDAFVWTGLVSAFVRAGFSEAARPARTRPIMRKTIRK